MTTRKENIIIVCFVILMHLVALLILAKNNECHALTDTCRGKMWCDATVTMDKTLNDGERLLSFDTTLCYEQFMCSDMRMDWEFAEENADKFSDLVSDYNKNRLHDDKTTSLMCEKIVGFVLLCNRNDASVSEKMTASFYKLLKDNDFLCSKLSEYMISQNISRECQDTVWYRIAGFIDMEILSYVEADIEISSEDVSDKQQKYYYLDSVHWRDFQYMSQNQRFLHFCRE